ncbi:RNA polymerase subunit sigma-70 [Enterocloster clostridioformis]|uniref:sigma-70 domain-containing protein n=1 Tax=Enterocloster clostridioformis TaxID=1531 RepID=UPI00080C8812|nr:sigma-70 domain-containing protein [Enterocloster clostridioformis]ANU50060.1 RNA polymerase subunit sigma-70 [Lachnoclostridium sp. YL32]NDO28447.1 RNA polymerase subunit sigma-70 [Enterocloster clostridioformis]OXE70875.1 RNA polymerase subunit sigma-70 [Enterocloster clostridioformis]QQR01039.1 RNA polymerase subunit sigma-70 [Enterocloster clostridioformis]
MEHDFFDMYLEEMGDITQLDRDEMNSVLEGTARGDAGARSRLVEGCLREVLKMVREYGDSELPLSDLVQEANTALMLAAIEYDGSEPWNELMTRRVKESVELALEEQRTENQIEETMAARVNVLQTVSQILAKELGREATLEELSAKMKMTEDEVKDIMKLALDALTVNGEGQAAASGRDEEERPNPVRNGWNLEEGL